MTTEELIRKATESHKAAGTDVRCPVCGAAAGFFCRIPNTNERAAKPHAERLALVNA
jgi:hypothetical protein